VARAIRLAALLAAANAPAGLHAQGNTPGNAEGRATARIVTNLQVIPLADLQFGAVIVGDGEAGEVTVSAGSAQNIYRGSARSGCGQEGGCITQPARFRISGEASRTYRIAIDGSVTARGQAWGGEIEVIALTTFSDNQASSDGTGVLDAAGIDYFAVGGTLSVPSGTAPDIFRADLPVIVSYE